MRNRRYLLIKAKKGFKKKYGREWAPHLLHDHPAGASEVQTRLNGMIHGATSPHSMGGYDSHHLGAMADTLEELGHPLADSIRAAGDHRSNPIAVRHEAQAVGGSTEPRVVYSIGQPGNSATWFTTFLRNPEGKHYVVHSLRSGDTPPRHFLQEVSPEHINELADDLIEHEKGPNSSRYASYNNETAFRLKSFLNGKERISPNDWGTLSGPRNQADLQPPTEDHRPYSRAKKYSKVIRRRYMREWTPHMFAPHSNFRDTTSQSDTARAISDMIVRATAPHPLGGYDGHHLQAMGDALEEIGHPLADTVRAAGDSNRSRPVDGLFTEYNPHNLHMSYDDQSHPNRPQWYVRFFRSPSGKLYIGHTFGSIQQHPQHGLYDNTLHFLQDVEPHQLEQYAHGILEHFKEGEGMYYRNVANNILSFLQNGRTAHPEDWQRIVNYVNEGRNDNVYPFQGDEVTNFPRYNPRNPNGDTPEQLSRKTPRKYEASRVVANTFVARGLAYKKGQFAPSPTGSFMNPPENSKKSINKSSKIANKAKVFGTLRKKLAGVY